MPSTQAPPQNKQTDYKALLTEPSSSNITQANFENVMVLKQYLEADATVLSLLPPCLQKNSFPQRLKISLNARTFFFWGCGSPLGPLYHTALHMSLTPASRHDNAKF